jgi:hypothetical protein
MRATLIAVIFFAACPAAVPAQSLSDCGCDDVREMRDRWCSARAAKREYERIEYFLKSESGKTGQTRMFSNADKKMINQKCVQEAINAVSDQGVVKATAVTNENSPIESLTKDECRIVVTKEGSACLKQIVEAHEGVHRQACLTRNEFVNAGYGKILSQLDIGGKLGLHILGDTKFVMASSEFAFEESVSYATEMQLLDAKWQELQQKCIAKAFEAELDNPDTAGQLWDRTQPDSNGKRIYKMYDLTNDPCPSRPRPPKSECTLQ